MNIYKINSKDFVWDDNLKSNNDIFFLENMQKWSDEIGKYIDCDLKQKIISFATSDKDSILIKNCPIGNLPDTPITSGCIDNEHIMFPAKFLFAVFSLMGIMPISYIGENFGKVIRHVVPKINQDNQISSHGYLEFNYHVDNLDLSLFGESNTQITPCLEFLALYCLRGDESAITEIINLRDIISYLSADEIKIALSNQFNIKRPDSFEDGNPIVKNVPLMTKYLNKYYSRYDFHNITSINDKSESVLNKIQDIYTNKIKSNKIVFEAGDLLVFKNQETMHKRSYFSPKKDGNDRWLMRVFGMSKTPQKYLNNQLILRS